MSYQRGDIREDGYIFLRYAKRGEKTYPVFISPLAAHQQKLRSKEWHRANKDYIKKYKNEKRIQAKVH